MDGKILKRAIDKHDALIAAHKQDRAVLRERVARLAPAAIALDKCIANAHIEAAQVVLKGGGEAELEQIAGSNLAAQEELKVLLIANGFPPDALDETPLCPLCDDHAFHGSTPCECLMNLYLAEQREELSHMLNVGSQTFETFKLEYYPQSVQEHMDTLFKICRNYAHNFSLKSENLYFHGLPGLGKTFLSCCIARLVADSGFSVVYETAVGLVSKMEKVKFKRNDDEDLEAEAERYTACDLLILDDLGTEMKTSFTISAVYDVINARLITKRPTIVNSNLSPEELYAEYSPQIASRLSGEYAPLHFLGTDIRQRRN